MGGKRINRKEAIEKILNSENIKCRLSIIEGVETVVIWHTFEKDGRMYWSPMFALFNEELANKLVENGGFLKPFPDLEIDNQPDAEIPPHIMNLLKDQIDE